MSSGAEDWTKLVNIFTQTLSEITIRNKYGTPTFSAAIVPVPSDEDTIILTILGKGMIYGGFVSSAGAATQRNDKVYIKLDGAVTWPLTFFNLNNFGLTDPTSMFPYLLKYDDINFLYTVGLNYGTTFETSLVIHYTETHGNTPTIYPWINYALI